jgi:hypothetical protein
MFVLRVNSSASLHGAETDDGFIIGRFSGETTFLVGATILGGILTGLLYLLIRKWLPERHRPLYYGAIGALIGGALFIRPDGIDFTKLDPLALACAMFILLPALHGIAVAALIERRLTRPSRNGWMSWIVLVLGLLPIGLFGIFGLALIVLIGAGWMLNRTGRLSQLWTSTPGLWTGRAVLTGLSAWAGVTLVSDVAAVLG